MSFSIESILNDRDVSPICRLIVASNSHSSLGSSSAALIDTVICRTGTSVNNNTANDAVSTSIIPVALTPFNLFRNLLNHPEIVYELSRYLGPDDCLSLYSMSKEYHELVNARFTTYASDIAETWAPHAFKVFHWKCYDNLCQRDPARNMNEELPDRVRDVPSFRWLKMITYRERTVRSIIKSLAISGHRLPKGVFTTLCKIWFMMDIGDSGRRIGLIKNRNIWTNKDLFLATMFQIKLDMRFNDPMDGMGNTELRKMLLAQLTLTRVDMILRGKEMMDHFDMLQMFIQWKYKPARDPQMPLFGVRPEEIGMLGHEHWNLERGPLIAIDEAIMNECIRRQLNVHHYYMDMLLFGNINEETDEDIWPYPAKEHGEDSDEEEDDDDEIAFSEGEDEAEVEVEGTEPEDLYGGPIVGPENLRGLNG